MEIMKDWGYFGIWSGFRLFIHLSTFLQLLYVDTVHVNKKIKTYNEFHDTP